MFDNITSLKTRFLTNRKKLLTKQINILINLRKKKMFTAQITVLQGCALDPCVDGWHIPNLFY